MYLSNVLPVDQVDFWFSLAKFRCSLYIDPSRSVIKKRINIAPFSVGLMVTALVTSTKYI